jgi:hypothetical protein
MSCSKHRLLHQPAPASTSTSSGHGRGCKCIIIAQSCISWCTHSHSLLFFLASRVSLSQSHHFPSTSPAPPSRCCCASVPYPANHNRAPAQAQRRAQKSAGGATRARALSQPFCVAFDHPFPPSRLPAIPAPLLSAVRCLHEPRTRRTSTRLKPRIPSASHLHPTCTRRRIFASAAAPAAAAHTAPEPDPSVPPLRGGEAPSRPLPAHPPRAPPP